MDLPVSERVARGFEAKYPGVKVRIERTGSERQFQRLAQEYAANIFAADVINASDASHFIAWKRNGWLEPYVPEDVARFFPPEHRDVSRFCRLLTPCDAHRRTREALGDLCLHA